MANISTLFAASFLLLCVPLLKADHPCSGVDSPSFKLVPSEEEFELQQLLVAGFRRNLSNYYNIRRFGFTADGGTERCIIVRYNIRCYDLDTNETCTDDLLDDKCIQENNTDWTFLWTSFETEESYVGRLLLNLAIYDLRVFGFELCDVYKDPVHVTFKLNSSELKIDTKSCDNICNVFHLFTTLLPGLSGSQLSPDSDTIPEAFGYASHWIWQEKGSFLTRKHSTITTFSVLIIAATKLSLLGFCYEILQYIRKHKIHKKTNDWYYYYWGGQVLMVLILAAVIYFELTQQRNKIALYIFLSSFGLDLFLLLLLAFCGCIVYTCADCCGCNTCCFGVLKWCIKCYGKIKKWCCGSQGNDNGEGGGAEEAGLHLMGQGAFEPEDDIDSKCVPPPLTWLIKCCPLCCCSHNSGIKTSGLFCLVCYPIFYCFCCSNNCFMCSSTLCCICECCGCWCCNAYGIPCCTYLPGTDEDDVNDPLYNNKSCKFCVDKRKKCNEFTWKKCGDCWRVCWTISANIISLLTFLAFVSYLSQAFPAIAISYYLNPTASLIRLGFIEVIIVVLLYEVAYLLFLMDKLTWLYYFKKEGKIPDEINPPPSTEGDKAESNSAHTESNGVHNETNDGTKYKTFISQYIDDEELIYNDICKCPSRCDSNPCSCCDHCHWLFPLTCIQIFTMLFITILSAVLLFFLFNVVIQQTSGSDNQFKDILAIVPTIALNLWLVFRQGDLFKAVKNIASKANEAVQDGHSAAENGGQAHLPDHQNSDSSLHLHTGIQ